MFLGKQIVRIQAAIKTNVIKSDLNDFMTKYFPGIDFHKRKKDCESEKNCITTMLSGSVELLFSSVG